MRASRRAGPRVRPWIAVAASYAVALQVMLVGIATSRLAAAEGPFAHGGFVVCSARSGFTGNQPGKPPTHDAACALCTLAASSPAILPAAAEAHFALQARIFHMAPVAATVVVSSRHTPRQSQGPPLPSA